MKKYVFILLWLCQGIAGAHGPTPQKIEERVKINATQEAVWAVLEDFQAIAEWHPLIASAEGEGGQTGAERTLRIQGREGVIIESLDEYEPDDYFLAYRLLQEDINVIPVSFYTMKIELSAADDGVTEVIWSARFYRADTGNYPPPEFSDEAAVKALEDFARQGLAALKAAVRP